MSLEPEQLTAAVAGDEHAFAEVYRELQPDLLRYLRVVVRNAAEDVASEVWFEVARDIRAFTGDPAGFRAWVFTIGRQRGIDWARRESRRPAVAMAEAPDVAGEDRTAEDVLESLDTAAALALIAQLPPDQAEAIVLRVVAGLDVAAVATILGKRPGAVRTNTLRGLRRLKTLLPARDESVSTRKGV